MSNGTLALIFSKGVSLESYRQIGNLSRELQLYQGFKKNFEKIYFFTYSQRDCSLPGIEVFPKKYNLPAWLYSLLLPWFFRSQFKKVDIVKVNQMNGAWSGLLVKFFFKKKLVIRCGYQWSLFVKQERQSFFKKLLIYGVEKILYKYADVAMVTSLEAKEYVKCRYQVETKLIPNYVDTDLFKPFNAGKIKNRLCFVGRLSPEKNLFNLFKAIHGLNVELVVFGDGPLREALQKEHPAVVFRGSIANHELPQELNKSAIFILPSLHEGNPKVLLEAMACALPVIGTRVQGIKEVITHNQTGLLCKTDPTSIRNAIETLLKDRGLQARLGVKAREQILAENSLDKIIQKEVDIYESL